MDLISIINQHNLNSVQLICKWIGEDDKRLKELAEIVFGNNKNLSRKASWSFYNYSQIHPEKVEKYASKMLALLETSNLHNAVYRNITGAFQYIKINEKLAGRLINCCVEFVSNPKTLPAITANCLTILHKFSKQYPELNSEIELLLEGLDMSKPSIRARVKTHFKKL